MGPNNSTIDTEEMSVSIGGKINDNGWPLTEDSLKDFDLSTLEYSALELAATGRTFENYQLRTRYIGLSGYERVLDFGCGLGQWTLALAKDNKWVVGIDKALNRINFANVLKHSMKVDNAQFELDGDQLEAESFDAIFCYSVFMFLHGPETAAWFSKLLKPGGKVYLMVDLPGWHLFALKRQPKQLLGIFYLIISTILGRKRNIVYTKRSLRQLMEQAGFEVVDEGGDGETSFLGDRKSGVKPPSFLTNHFAGLQTLFEICAVKR
jgi:SAM-dependent methyltransferase